MSRWRDQTRTVTRSSASSARLTSPRYCTSGPSTISQTLCQPLRSKSSRRRFHSTIRSGPSIRPQGGAVAGRPRLHDQVQQRRRLAADLVGGERRVVGRRLGGGQLDAAARGRGASCACGAPGIAVDDGREQDEGEERADEDQERDPAAAARAARAAAARAAAATAAGAAASAAPAAAEARAAAAGAGPGGRGAEREQRDGDQQDPGGALHSVKCPRSSTRVPPISSVGSRIRQSRCTGTDTVPPMPALAPNATWTVPRIFSSSRMLPVSSARSLVPMPSSATLRPSGAGGVQRGEQPLALGLGRGHQPAALDRRAPAARRAAGRCSPGSR